ncbi:hypothetical protein AMATHDRAFT_51758 [Amanita thiersii Skay4041]|uniref:Uncharacterized protein n=1 Tax=Amanita thiersii Skay4041 TaxID=703135 RepID=A0A2A9NAC7_9AGAR|nr:hypothetical protein AMATHDRAFT_51758 [Amanita thiersii Skay4041]
MVSAAPLIGGRHLHLASRSDGPKIDKRGVVLSTPADPDTSKGKVPCPQGVKYDDLVKMTAAECREKRGVKWMDKDGTCYNSRYASSKWPKEEGGCYKAQRRNALRIMTQDEQDQSPRNSPLVIPWHDDPKEVGSEGGGQ